MSKRLILAGAGHAHVAVLAKLKMFLSHDISVTVVSPDELHPYSGMGPGVLSGQYSPAEISFPVAQMTRDAGAEFIADKVIRIDPTARSVHLSSGSILGYDVLSLNVGSEIPWPGETPPEKIPDLYPVKPISNLYRVRERLEQLMQRGKAEVLVLGGGPASLEIAGNLHGAAQEIFARKGGSLPCIRILAGRRFLSELSGRARKKARHSLNRRGIKVHESGYVAELGQGGVTLENGRVVSGQLMVMALGVRPPKLMEYSGLAVGPDGGLRVNRFLQSVSNPEIFAGGDCLYFEPFPLNKVGVYAVRQHAVLVKNLYAALTGGELEEFRPGGDYLLVFNLGDGTGILQKAGLVLGGKLAFRVKDFIDHRFMHRFGR
ncbi:FAD-dependent oxidoreductase [Desulfobaculum bizertense]|uniref:NAD(P)/FAD-dependent oxidoreductase n=1 Tax=Desulfobaculum bizertense TaxID=376490 RepID=UPI001F16B34E|nr:FAD-dependent oxidoreductase [Desulfobaculum bizertense]UIJ37488.1 FAD-dependent oxidoreductase [Desulfobaculum bizertense]